YADDNPGQMTAQALFCFNDKLIYSGCDEAYRLNPSGNINVPPEAADQFCNGPCLFETQQILNCINNILSNFLFYNKATIPDVRYALNAGCSNTNQRGSKLSLLLEDLRKLDLEGCTKQPAFFCFKSFPIQPPCISSFMVEMLSLAIKEPNT
ncbi:hypothetical protein SO802_013716, partial [Lithocarpus litseifolius]